MDLFGKKKIVHLEGVVQDLVNELHPPTKLVEIKRGDVLTDEKGKRWTSEMWSFVGKMGIFSRRCDCHHCISNNRGRFSKKFLIKSSARIESIKEAL